MSGTGNEPRIRARINHSRTQKDGWRHETTVEIDEWTAGPGANLNTMFRELMNDLDALGREESDRRNRADGMAVAQ
jgi:hypothetical protein